MTVIQLRPRAVPMSTFTRPPRPIMRKPNDGEDLIFAVIEHHRALSKRYDMAVNLYNDREGSIETFRPYALPGNDWIEGVAKQFKRLLVESPAKK